MQHCACTIRVSIPHCSCIRCMYSSLTELSLMSAPLHSYTPLPMPSISVDPLNPIWDHTPEYFLWSLICGAHRFNCESAERLAQARAEGRKDWPGPHTRISAAGYLFRAAILARRRSQTATPGQVFRFFMGPDFDIGHLSGHSRNCSRGVNLNCVSALLSLISIVLAVFFHLQVFTITMDTEFNGRLTAFQEDMSALLGYLRTGQWLFDIYSLHPFRQRCMLFNGVNNLEDMLRYIFLLNCEALSLPGVR